MERELIVIRLDTLNLSDKSWLATARDNGASSHSDSSSLRSMRIRNWAKTGLWSDSVTRLLESQDLSTIRHWSSPQLQLQRMRSVQAGLRFKPNELLSNGFRLKVGANSILPSWKQLGMLRSCRSMKSWSFQQSTLNRFCAITCRMDSLTPLMRQFRSPIKNKKSCCLFRGITWFFFQGPRTKRPRIYSMSLFLFATLSYPEWRWELMKTNLWPANVKDTLTAPLLPIMFFQPVAIQSVSIFCTSGQSRTCMKTTKCVAWSDTELTMTQLSPKQF